MPMGVPLPPEGDNSWYDWATEVHALVDAFRGAQTSGVPPDPLVAGVIWVDETDFTTYLIYDDGTSVSPVQIATPFGSGEPIAIDGGTP